VAYNTSLSPIGCFNISAEYYPCADITGMHNYSLNRQVFHFFFSFFSAIVPLSRHTCRVRWRRGRPGRDGMGLPVLHGDCQQRRHKQRH
jgi:hypothetical protein